MLHEVLFALSGHPSPLFNGSGSYSSRDPAFPLLTPAEASLLQPLGDLATLHRDIKAHARRIAASHPPTICLAVMKAIVSNHVSQFQQKILDVERDILIEDAGTVAAYGIVPLASIVSEFGEWKRRLEWYWEVLSFILPDQSANTDQTCTGAALINKLRDASLTGYPDIESAALNLSAVAERAWLRQLSFWLIYGKLPDHAPSDFMIQGSQNAKRPDADTLTDPAQFAFSIEKHLTPGFVTQGIAASILSIGRSLNQLQSVHSTEGTNSSSSAPTPQALRSTHLEELSRLKLPLSPVELAVVLQTIRHSLSRNVINVLLPSKKTLQILSYLRAFFLLGRNDFSESLMRKAESYLLLRQKQSYKGSRDLAGIVLKEAEVAAVLSQTWADLEASAGMKDSDSDELEWAREHLRLKISKPAQAKNGQDVFSEFLLSTPTILTLALSSPHNLFFSEHDLLLYSSIHNYMLSLNRTLYRMTDLWRQTRLRKERSTPRNPRKKYSRLPGVFERASKRSAKRNMEMRLVWVRSSAAISLLSAISQYMNGEVIENSWQTFRQFASISNDITSDPDTLAEAHREYLTVLHSALLLGNLEYTNVLRTFLVHCDQLVGFIHRLQRVQNMLDLQEDDGVVDAPKNHLVEEVDVKQELDTTQGILQKDMKELITCLRKIDGQHDMLANFGGFKVSLGTDFRPWNRNGLDHLLMKLDGSTMANDPVQA